MECEILLPKGIARKAIRVCLALVILVGLTVLGRQVSPQEQGRPRLLSPGLAAVTAYLRNARQWTRELKEIQSKLGELLSNSAGDLLAQDQLANELRGRLLSLEADLDVTRVPFTFDSLHDALGDTATLTLQACMTITQWLNEPTADNTSLAQTALEDAESAWERLNQNPWIAQP